MKAKNEPKKKRLCDEEIIAALIQKGSIKAAAAFLGCTQRTIYDRKKKENFRRIYDQAKGDIVKDATAKLQGQLSAAIDTLTAIMTDEEAPKQTRVNCAVSILQYGVKLTETTDILTRLETIEQFNLGTDEG